MSITSAAIYSEADKNALHVRTADEAYLIGKAPASESYLNIPKIVRLAKEIKADAIHPGYGFLSENAEFIKEIENAGLVFVGPSASSVELMGNKTKARKLMEKNNVPIVPGTTEPIASTDRGKQVAEEIGFPVMLKASAGGGGKGMRKVDDKGSFQSAFERAQNESLKAFGSNEIYIEKFIDNPKHIEVQILADQHGNYVHLFERECSMQRRHQKVIEEAPSPSLDDLTRTKITEAGINAAKACGYFNAGTIEFLMDSNKNFYFLEMNTRLQVEHPVTELITGIDLVKEQIRIAAGEKLSFKQDEIRIKNHSVECRVYAEDVDNNFAPSTGTITHHRLPSGPGIRIDRGIDLLTEVPVHYDPLLSKVISCGKDREEALARMEIALSSYQVAGVITNIHFLKWLIEQKEFVDCSFTINFIENNFLKMEPGSWKIESNKKYKDAAIIMGALLGAKENELKPSETVFSKNNKWNIF